MMNIVIAKLIFAVIINLSGD